MSRTVAIPIKQAFNLSFNVDYLATAGEVVTKLASDLREEYGDDEAEEILEAVATLLLFRELERGKPGTIETVQNSLQAIHPIP